MVENAQDGVIRSLYESSDGSLSAVSDADISIDAIIGFLEAESTGGRLTKEFIEAWFATSVHDALYVVIADKLHYDGLLTPEQECTVEKHINGYKGIRIVFCKVFFEVLVCENIYLNLIKFFIFPSCRFLFFQTTQ